MGNLHLLQGINEEHYKSIEEQHNVKSIKDHQQYIHNTSIRKTKKWKFKWHIKLIGNTCNRSYIGQPGGTISIRYKEHIRYIETNNHLLA